MHAFAKQARTSFNSMTNSAEFGYAVQGWCKRFNDGDYFEAHEVAEECWHRASEPQKSFLKGLIHAAVALCHYQRQNAHGARVKYVSAKRYLSAYLPHYGGIEVDRLLAEMELYFTPLLASPPDHPLPRPGGPAPQVRTSG